MSSSPTITLGEDVQMPGRVPVLRLGKLSITPDPRQEKGMDNLPCVPPCYLHPPCPYLDGVIDVKGVN